eukprot:gene13360-20189_t
MPRNGDTGAAACAARSTLHTTSCGEIGGIADGVGERIVEQRIGERIVREGAAEEGVVEGRAVGDRCRAEDRLRIRIYAA